MGVYLEKTKCYSYFNITSAGEFRSVGGKYGFAAFENSGFDPDEITGMLGIAPFQKWKIGEPFQNGKGIYRFSTWACCRQEQPAMSAEEQCLNIVHFLTPYIPKLKTVKQKYNVDFTIMIVPHVYHEQCPILNVSKEIIEFCYLTGTEIAFDMYIYDKE